MIKATIWCVKCEKTFDITLEWTYEIPNVSCPKCGNQNIFFRDLNIDEGVSVDNSKTKSR